MISIFGQDESKTVNKPLNNRNNDYTEKKPHEVDLQMPLR